MSFLSKILGRKKKVTKPTRRKTVNTQNVKRDEHYYESENTKPDISVDLSSNDDYCVTVSRFSKCSGLGDGRESNDHGGNSGCLSGGFSGGDSE